MGICKLTNTVLLDRQCVCVGGGGEGVCGVDHWGGRFGRDRLWTEIGREVSDSDGSLLCWRL